MVAEKDGKSDRKGLFSFYVDGYEAYMTPEKIDGLQESELDGITQRPESLERKETAKGDPIFKIADNSAWYLVCWIDEEKIARYEKDKQVKVKLPKGTIEANVYEVNEAGSKWQLVLKTNRYYKDFLKVRSLDAEIITTDMEGLLVSNDCLAMKGKKVGCYVKDRTGDYVFKEVQTLATDGEKTLVTETQFFDDKGTPVMTVKAYDEVKRDPD
jgi:putative membrane fusion protein